VTRRIVSVLMVSAILLATMVAPAFAGSVSGCDNQCGDGGDGDLNSNSSQTAVVISGPTEDNSIDNSTNNVTINQTSTTTNSVNNTINCNAPDSC
jgi:hypothetical protein